MGGKSFAESLKEGLQNAVQGRRRESHSGPAREAHDQAAAERKLDQAMEILGLDPESLEKIKRQLAALETG